MTALDSVAPVVGALRPIGLDELVDRAELLTRLDRKYMLPLTDLPLVVGGLDGGGPSRSSEVETGGVQVLEVDGERRFAYRSVYFDTPDMAGYLAAAHRRRRRFKLRIRTYLASGQHFLEVKTRGPRGTTVKQRVPYDGEPGRLGPEARAYVDDVLRAAGIDSHGFRLVPALTTRYLRTTLFLPGSGSRVTLDTDLTWALPDGTALRTPERTIVETKAGRAGSSADRLLWSLRHRPCPVSKYGTGLAALRPDLPANRWLPVLRRHFPTAPALNGSPA
ncbi:MULTISPECIES: VTC domain-containing protein [unclassified Streptomyces]|uniref:VTC domain-containing protein n=1 Tax=unclassified Streptomyces TaxID=2593676 RepID=UPI002E774000|nr:MULTISPECIES: VTC domain-containing protein [unclassified Streptomyces]MEE1763230.1 VTC domain-containing protein [Streptomyces sp. SP18BB07]MEE1837259.1 VTC domain-containing protein [Streptomyces sp. SP17KL33]